MKHLIPLITLTIIISLTVLFSGRIWALDASSSATPSAAAPIGQKAQDLLNQVATKVAQLSLKMQKSYHGQIKSIGDTSFVIGTAARDRTVSTNDATGFFRIRAGKRTEVNFQSFKIGDDIAAVGVIDPVSTDLTARQVIAKVARLNVVGTIKSIDPTNYVITASDGTDVKIDLSGVPLKKIDAKGKIVSAKPADFALNSEVFAIAVSPDPDTGIYSVLKALTIPNPGVK